jgi:hypothetical protein
MQFIATKYSNVLQPDDSSMIAGIKNGEAVWVEIKRPRNIKHHRLYWGLIAKVHENISHERYPTTAFLSDVIKVAVGECKPFEMADGSIAMIPGSIAFSKMSQDDFSRFFNRVCDVVCTRILPGLEAGQLKNEISQMVGIPVSEMG